MTTSYVWTPIAPLLDSERSIDLASIGDLYETWGESKKRLQESSPAEFRKFRDELFRRLSIETGILESLYDLDRGTTEALVAHGFVQDLIPQSATGLEPSRLVDILRDHEAAILLVIDCLAGSRELSVGVMHELHAILTRHQDTTVAVDPLGNQLRIPLLKGQFKQQSNNPKRPDGTIHEYCPPLQVASQVEQLLDWASGYADEDPIVVASWFHHRFTQIHPYQDGNGRVVRALTTLLLMRQELLPIVIDRDLRMDYIGALERADQGSLTPLAELFAGLERASMMQALSVTADTDEEAAPTLTAGVIQGLAAKLARREEAKSAELRRVNGVAEKLRECTRRVVEKALGALGEELRGVTEPDIRMTEGGPERQNAHWYKHEVVESARRAGKHANFDESHYFLKASMRVARERLVFVTSFHHVGRELSGVMEATTFARLETFEESDDRRCVSQDFFVCSPEPFVFTYMTESDDIANSFDRWLDIGIAVALREFGDRI